MISHLNIWPVALWAFGLWFLGSWAIAATRYSRKTKSHGCGTLKTYPHRDPTWLGLDFVLSMSRAFKEHRWLMWMEDTWATVGTKTWQARFMGSRMIYSSEMENMKAMSTSQWQEFVLEPIRVDNGVATPFTGKGVSTADGAFWHRSREYIKPYFERQAFANLDRLQATTDRMLDLIPTDGTTFDMQVLIRRWVSFAATLRWKRVIADEFGNSSWTSQRNSCSAETVTRSRFQNARTSCWQWSKSCEEFASGLP
jgi:cytochrome P450 monooxygenase